MISLVKVLVWKLKFVLVVIYIYIYNDGTIK